MIRARPDVTVVPFVVDKYREDLNNRIRPLTSNQHYSMIQPTDASLLNRHMLHFYCGVVSS